MPPSVPCVPEHDHAGVRSARTPALISEIERLKARVTALRLELDALRRRAAAQHSSSEHERDER